MTSGPPPAGTPHVEWPTVAGYVDDGTPTVIPLAGEPRIEFFVDAYGARTGLRIALEPSDRVPLSSLTAVVVRPVAAQGRRMLEIATAERALFRDFHDLLQGVAERVRRAGHSPARAFTETLASWTELLARNRGISEEKRVGLLGELHALEWFAHHFGWPVAVASWRGPSSEEHDFGLPGYDVEVKSTASERRLHTVRGTTQLVPTGDRPLWLLSLQFTRGGSAGHTLAERVRSVREQVAEHAPDLGPRLTELLARCEWLGPLAAAPDPERWSLRSAPLVVSAADERVPRLGPEVLAALSGEARQRIVALTYGVDLTGLPDAADAPDALRPPAADGLPLGGQPTRPPPAGGTTLATASPRTTRSA
ncbi:PD-(D/E)XK motif protein [Streptomyces sp. AC563]|uniref:PD-(D/E)XK motif protein n=1 Tax=Streptomyces buecherae TaxID=2763006 RepID=UPI00164D3B35|nr:PD-(D/E)XK motif protein [Streptomyces buecherae]MBC3989187.1 PD-(D/E)XK motif protein [Streptomyces buecherae]